MWSNSNKEKQFLLEQVFQRLDIDYSKPGFYDAPDFLQEERENPRFLENYALYVEHKEYSTEYLEKVESIIIECAQRFHSVLNLDGRKGACVDASTIFSRMLDELGIWNYVTNSAVNIKFPSKSGVSNEHFWLPTEQGITAAHSIVVSPPFGVIDLTIKNQSYPEEKISYLPEYITSKHFKLGKWTPEEVYPPEVIFEMKKMYINPIKYSAEYDKAMYEVLSNFPCRIVDINECTIKYMTIAIGGSVYPLKNMIGYKPNGRMPIDIFKEDILPYV